MAPPPQAIERLTQESSRSPGWSGRMLMFASALLFLSLVTWLGLRFGYNTVLAKDIKDNTAKIENMSNASEDKQNEMLVMYSQIKNIAGLIENHTYGSAVLSFLGNTIHPNAYLSGFSYSATNNQISLTGFARSAKDIAQQVYIYGADKNVKSVKLNNVRNQGSNVWYFDATIITNPELTKIKSTEDSSVNSGGSPSNSSSSANINSSSTSTSTSP